MPIQFPRRRTRSNAVANIITSGSGAVLNLMELRQRERISGEKAAFDVRKERRESTQAAARVATGRKQAETASQRLVETRRSNVETERLAKQKFDVENADRLPFTTQRTERVNQTFAAIGVDTPKSLTNILNTHIKAGATAGAVYDDLSQGSRWDVITEAGADDLQKQYDKMIDPKTGTLIPGSDQANQILGIIDELRQDGSSKRILNMLFSNTITARTARTAEKAGFSAPFLRGDVEVQAGPTGRIVATPTKKVPAVPKGVPTQTQLAAAEEKILSDPTHPANAAQARLFNKNTEEPAAYVEGKVEVPGKVFGTNTVDGWLKIEFANANEVKAAFTEKKITRDIAERLLKKHFGMN